MADAQFGDYYRLIYMKGLGGEQPTVPVDWAELERRAEEAMEPRAAAYTFAGAGSGLRRRAAPKGNLETGAQRHHPAVRDLPPE